MRPTPFLPSGTLEQIEGCTTDEAVRRLTDWPRVGTRTEALEIVGYLLRLGLWTPTQPAVEAR